jgi:hypothetical protein
MVALFCPTHGFTTPWGMIVFALRMPRVKGAHAVISASRAGWLIGPWRLPGLEGATGLLLALILPESQMHRINVVPSLALRPI